MPSAVNGSSILKFDVLCVLDAFLFTAVLKDVYLSYNISSDHSIQTLSVKTDEWENHRRSAVSELIIAAHLLE